MGQPGKPSAQLFQLCPLSCHTFRVRSAYILSSWLIFWIDRNVLICSSNQSKQLGLLYVRHILLTFRIRSACFAIDRPSLVHVRTFCANLLKVWRIRSNTILCIPMRFVYVPNTFGHPLVKDLLWSHPVPCALCASIAVRTTAERVATRPTSLTKDIHRSLAALK